jgi:hypothetical protein
MVSDVAAISAVVMIAEKSRMKHTGISGGEACTIVGQAALEKAVLQNSP